MTDALTVFESCRTGDDMVEGCLWRSATPSQFTKTRLSQPKLLVTATYSPARTVHPVPCCVSASCKTSGADSPPCQTWGWVEKCFTPFSSTLGWFLMSCTGSGVTEQTNMQKCESSHDFMSSGPVAQVIKVFLGLLHAQLYVHDFGPDPRFVFRFDQGLTSPLSRQNPLKAGVLKERGLPACFLCFSTCLLRQPRQENGVGSVVLREGTSCCVAVNIADFACKFYLWRVHIDPMQTAARLLCPASTLPPPPLLPGSTKSAGHSFPPRGDGVVPTQNGWRQTAADKEAAECLSWGGSQQVGLVGTGAPVTASSHSSQVASYSVLLRWVVSFHGIVFLLLLVRDLSLNSQAVAQSARLYGNGTCTCQGGLQGFGANMNMGQRLWCSCCHGEGWSSSSRGKAFRPQLRGAGQSPDASTEGPAVHGADPKACSDYVPPHYISG
ncbi:hypothetical protein Anapl_00910 [Anas platyrhynchos]|uniref:Uncharacterized protein n=1 Tax=Anas platyrhynchos TaxID=8839 RepID=R0LMA6_ANAPL|nr:hypothetical protein Anapl_00910 [Anas platyrhynchos]